MTDNFFRLARPAVRNMQPYQPGKPIEEAQRELGLDSMVKLASNENPCGPSTVVRAEIESAVADIHLYPDANAYYLKRQLSEKLGVDASQITLGNGSNDLLELIASAFLDAGSSAIYSQYGFLVYALAVARSGAEAIEVAANNYGHDLPAMLNSVRHDTRVIYIANPNNPTGTYVPVQQVIDLLDALPSHVLVVLDEAYVEYVGLDDYPDGVALSRTYENLIVTRTFSKAYGLAGMRVGYSISHPDVADLLNRVRMPFNVSSLALKAAAAALRDEAYLEESVKLNTQGMQQTCQGLTDLGLSYIPSVANFVSFEPGTGDDADASAIYDALLRSGVIVRPVANYDLPGHLRVSIGLEDENAKFLQSLTSILKG